MEKSECRNTRKCGVRRMNSIALRPSINEAIADALRPFSVKALARRIKTSARTIENWKQAKTGPQAKHVAAILNDDELCERFLEAMGRKDLAQSAVTIAALKRALVSEGK